MRRKALLQSMLVLLLWVSPASLAANPDRIDHPEKIGVGTWVNTTPERMLADVERLGASWFYTWQPENATGSPKFVPMIWGAEDVPELQEQDLGSQSVLLTFNEPDHAEQANLSVEQALSLWPKLMETSAARLGSPATTTPGARGPNGWLARFMREADARGYKVDFITVHYYEPDADVCRFRRFLQRIHDTYQRPIWVTEWALADWQNPGRFTAEEQSKFILAAAHMLDDLPYVERHAWFAAYEADSIALNSGLLDLNSSLTPIGTAFRELTRPGSEGPDAARRCE